MQQKMFGNEFHTTIVCVDSYDKHIFCGRLYNPYVDKAIPFQSLMELLLAVDTLLDEMQFPQSFVAKRQFSPVRTALQNAEDLSQQKGKLATFALRILFRQNASWQGSVTWSEAGRSESFRSTLELLFLLNSALSEEAQN